MDRGAWRATVDGVAEWDGTEQLTLSLFISVERHADNTTAKCTGNQQIKTTGDRICHRKGVCGESNIQESNELACHTE